MIVLFIIIFTRERKKKELTNRHYDILILRVHHLLFSIFRYVVLTFVELMLDKCWYIVNQVDQYSLLLRTFEMVNIKLSTLCSFL